MSRTFKIILNLGSGHDSKNEARDLISLILSGAGYSHEFIGITDPTTFPSQAEKTVRSSIQDGSVVVAAGGDGTINTVAGFCHRYGVPLGIIPMGTFNFFARDLNIPVDLEQAVTLLTSGEIQDIPVGMVNDRIFLVHTGIGLYSEIMRNREKDKSRFGRYQCVAFVSSFLSLMRTKRVHRVEIAIERETIRRTTLNVFVGNNILQLEKLGLVAAHQVAPDELAIILLRPLSMLQRLRLAFLGLRGTMQMDAHIERFKARNFMIATDTPRLKAAIDGELVNIESPLRFQSLPVGLKVIVP